MGDVAALTWPLTRPGGLLCVPNRRARRCLFGPVDHEALQKQLEEERLKAAEEDKLRWNFDFQSGRPLPPGRYVWEKVGGDPSDADSNGGSTTHEDDKQSATQTKITDFMRKRKSSASNQKDPPVTQPAKSRRRSST